MTDSSGYEMNTTGGGGLVSAAPGTNTVHIKGAKVTRSESSIPGSEQAWERKFQGANWPGSYWPIRSGEGIGPGAKRLGTGIIIFLGTFCIVMA